MKICRLFRHIVQTRLGLHRRFPAQTLDAIEAAVHRGELRHDGEVRFAVEAELDLPALWRDQTPRERALEDRRDGRKVLGAGVPASDARDEVHEATPATAHLFDDGHEAQARGLSSRVALAGVALPRR